MTTTLPTTLRLGTRRSELATTQSTWVADRLRELGHQVELVEIVTEGDTNLAPMTTIGGTGVFAAAIRQALLRDEVDIAVHSLKDLPVAPEPGLVIAAIPVREDPRDVLVARDGLTLGEIPAGGVIGTGSTRRAAQINALGLGVEVRGIRGNVGTRMARIDSGECDAVVLARAGLARLGLLDRATEVIDPLQMLPAPGQGALAIECRESDTALVEALRAIDDADTRAATTAERALLQTLEAGCSAPVGALAEVAEEEDGRLVISLRAFVGTLDGSLELRRSWVGPYDTPEQVGRGLAAVLLEDGAADAVRKPAGPSQPSPERRTEVPNATEREK
ncbi:hydroxymethylbilane synthase [Luteipulveratus halotolerans]|uniref:Porphobilinogen deaminase n=1 Tax=Luteipulveratus halotolerans TaxID=1631356 RepID=A0A0L6CEC3_9MICO|nr:hydroxymethylbilane synthase [Luteipulveratus halotolerans]KNX36226.1 porphobilinogen deaminase [Luteipulveratus halotolerans]